jgi:hypothetical protein
MRRLICLLAFAFLIAPGAAWAASAYTDLLKKNFATAMTTHNDPFVLDHVEEDLLNCLADAFINANIPPADLALLDEAVADGTIEFDPLAGKYAALANDPGALSLMSLEAMRLCPETIRAYNAAKKG